MAIPFVIVDQRKVTLEQNCVVVYRDEIVCYHKRDYDWVEKSRHVFADDKQAKAMFDLISDAERSGQRKAKTILAPRVGIVLKELEEKIRLLLKRVTNSS